MKKRLGHRGRVIAILLAFAVAIGLTTFTIAAGRTEARVTQAIHNVQLLAPTALGPPVYFFDWAGYRLVLWQRLFLRQVSFRRVDFTAA
jgi:hypothetical protein